jgi:hypothetical protein
MKNLFRQLTVVGSILIVGVLIDSVLAQLPGRFYPADSPESVCAQIKVGMDETEVRRNMMWSYAAGDRGYNSDHWYVVGNGSQCRVEIDSNSHRAISIRLSKSELEYTGPY